MEHEIVTRAGDDAICVVDAFVKEHQAAAIPALIGACVMWAVQHGGADLITDTLGNAQRLAANVKAARARSAQ